MSLSNAELNRLSRRIDRSREDILGAGLGDEGLRDIYNRARKNFRNRIKIGVICAYSAFGLASSSADHISDLAEQPQIAEGIRIMQSNPDTKAVGDLYMSVLTSPKTPFYAKLATGGQILIAAGFLPFNLRRRRKLGEEIGHAANTVSNAPQNAMSLN